MALTRLTHEPLPPLASEPGPDDSGAELIFHGYVRGQEGGTPIRALYYEAYEEMAAKELERVAQEALARFPIAALRCWHRIGEVPVGAPSLRIVIRSKHRAEALEAMAWFIDQLKQHVPIYKWAVDARGHRRPCGEPGAAP